MTPELQKFINVEVAMRKLMAEHDVTFDYLTKARRDLVSEIPSEGVEVGGYRFSKIVKTGTVRKQTDDAAFFKYDVITCSKIKQTKKES